MKEIRLHRVPWYDELELYVAERHPDGKMFLMQPGEAIELEQHENAIGNHPPLMRWTGHDPGPQQLMNQLWELGYRPGDGGGSLAHVEATGLHLDDMRGIAFRLMDRVLGEKDREPPMATIAELLRRRRKIDDDHEGG